MIKKLFQRLSAKKHAISADELLMLIGTRELTPAERKLYHDLKKKENSNE